VATAITRPTSGMKTLNTVLLNDMHVLSLAESAANLINRTREIIPLGTGFASRTEGQKTRHDNDICDTRLPEHPTSVTGLDH
jgi:hypothetical protein